MDNKANISVESYNLKENERKILIDALKNSDTLWQAAEKCGISRHMYRRLLIKHDLYIKSKPGKSIKYGLTDQVELFELNKVK